MTKRPGPNDPRVRKRLVEAIRRGHYGETAASLAGIGTSTFYKWIAIGKEQREAGEQGSLVELVEEIENAMAEAEERYLAIIENATASQWQAAAWILERRHPAKWGRRFEARVERPAVEQRPSLSIPAEAMGPLMELLESRRLPMNHGPRLLPPGESPRAEPARPPDEPP